MFEPYAAKAIVEYEFDTDHLNIWLTFRFPMNQLVDPATTSFIASVDAVEKTIASIAWQDAYTLLLVVNSIASAPARVLVKFDGPDSNLETTWHKNWEPFGYILGTDLTATFLPVGTILLWSGSIATIPTGFALCDGSNSTPDLRNRFVVCAGDTYAVDATGGSTQHTHALSIDTHDHTLIAGENLAQGTDFSDITSQESPGGSADLVTALPPYYALAYIMKT